MQDFISNNIMKIRTEAFTAENTPWSKVFTGVIEMYLGTACFKLENRKQSIAMRAVKIERTKHFTSISTFFS